MGGHRGTALKETDQAAMVRARDAVRRLDVLALRLCRNRVTDEDICTLREATQDIMTALEVARTIAERSHKEATCTD